MRAPSISAIVPRRTGKPVSARLSDWREIVSAMSSEREDLLVVLGERDLHHRVVLRGAEDDADRLPLVLGALEAIDVVHVHLHLPEILACAFMTVIASLRER